MMADSIASSGRTFVCTIELIELDSFQKNYMQQTSIHDGSFDELIPFFIWFSSRICAKKKTPPNEIKRYTYIEKKCRKKKEINNFKKTTIEEPFT